VPVGTGAVNKERGMWQAFMALDGLDKLFAVCAAISTVIFLLRMLSMVAGGDADIADAGDVADASFQILSINTVTAFLMMFGWMGLAAHRQFNLSAGLALWWGLGAGGFSMLVTAWLFSAARKLTSKGSVFTIDELVGCNGSVYQQIPAKGRGRIQIKSTDGMLREVDAVSADGTVIQSFSTITVVSVVDHQTVTVKEAA